MINNKQAVVNILTEVLHGFGLMQDYGETTGGFTIWAETGVAFDTPAYLVGGSIPSLVLSPNLTDEDTLGLVEDWYVGVTAVQGNSSIVGGWIKDGFLHLDAITLVHSERQALLLGKIFNQQAVGQLTINGEFKELEVSQ